MNRIISFLTNQGICPTVVEPRTDTVPIACLTGLLAITIAGIWLRCVFNILNLQELPVENNEESTESSDTEELQEETPDDDTEEM